MPNLSIQVDVNTSLHQPLEGDKSIFMFSRPCQRAKIYATVPALYKIHKTELPNQFTKHMLV